MLLIRLKGDPSPDVTDLVVLYSRALEIFLEFANGLLDRFNFLTALIAAFSVFRSSQMR